MIGTTLVVAIVFVAMDFFFHHVCLGNLHAAHMHLYRSMEEAKTFFPYMYFGYILFAFLFTAIYGRWFKEGEKKWFQGLRYGLVMGLFYMGTMILLMLPFVPFSKDLYWSWFAVGMVEFLVLGLIVGLIFKPGDSCCSSDGSCCS